MKTALTALSLSCLVALACEAPPSEPTPSAQKDPQGQAPKTTAGATTATATTAAPQAKGPFPESTHPALEDPASAKEKAPDTFKVKFETTAGDFMMECHREWAPNGVDRVYNLVKIGFFDDVAFFRVAKGFVVQFGIHGNPEVSKHWRDANVEVDPQQTDKDKRKQSNTRGMVTFAMAGKPETRSTQLFINFGDNARLDDMGFAPVCKVSEDDMAVVMKIHSGYGETPSKAQGQIQMQGNKFLREKFPLLDFIKTARLVGGDEAPAASGSASAGPAPSASTAPSAKAGATADPKATTAGPK